MAKTSEYIEFKQPVLTTFKRTYNRAEAVVSMCLFCKHSATAPLNWTKIAGGGTAVLNGAKPFKPGVNYMFLPIKNKK